MDQTVAGRDDHTPRNRGVRFADLLGYMGSRLADEFEVSQ
jgi:hypothetical protein